MSPLHIKLPIKEVFEVTGLLKLSNMVNYEIYDPKTLQIGEF